MTLARHRSLARLTSQLALTLALLLALAGRASAQGFQSVFSRDGIDVWAVGDGGAVWRSFDSGAKWTAAPSPGAGTLRGVAARGLTALVVGDGGKVHRSVNSGGTWTTQTLAGAPDLRGLEWPADNAVFAVGGDGAIYFSSDGGQVWAPQASGTSAKLYAVRFRDASNGWAVGAGGVALRTTNGGALWSPVVVPTTKDLYAVDFIGADAWVVGGYGAALKTANSGGVWTPINLKLDSQGDVRGVWMETATKVTLTGGGGFLRTTPDGGTTWTWANHPLLGPSSDYFVFGSKAWLVSSANRAVARTSDSGANWAFANGTTTTWDWQNTLPAPYVIVRGNTFATTPQNRDLVWCVIAQYIYKSRDRGQTWALLDSIPNCIKTNSFYVSPKDTTKWVAAVGTPDRIIRTSNSGLLWSPGFLRDFSEYGMPLEMNPDKPDTLLFAPEDGKLWRSKDFGVTWDSLSAPLFRSPCDIVIVPGDDSKILVGDGVTGTGFGQIFQSTNGGTSFTLRYTGPSSEVPTVWGNRLENNVLFATNWSNGGVWRSTDYGTNWTLVSAISSAWGGATSNDDPRVVAFNRYAGIPNYLSTDQGATFVSQNMTNPGAGYSLLGLDRSTWLDMHSFGVYRLVATQAPLSALIQELTLTSPNGGESWGVGSLHFVTWSSSNVALARIEYRNGPADTWHLVADVESYLGTYNWTLPNDPTNTAEVRVSDAWDGSPIDGSDAPFAIVGPRIAVTPASIAYAAHPINTATLDTLRITNPGNGTLHITGISTGNAAFTVGRTALMLGAGASDTLSVTFRPILPVAYNATLTLTNDAGAPVTVPLSGTGQDQTSIVLLSPLTGAGWQYNHLYNITWQSQGVTNVAVEYRTGEAQPWIPIADPVAAALGTQPWTIPNAPTTQARVRVRQSGGALEAMSGLFSLTMPGWLQPPVFDFGQVPPSYSTWDTLHVENPGNAPLTVSNVTSDNPRFKLPRTSFVVPLLASDSLSVWFRPTGAGADSALVTFTTDDVAGTHTLRVRGTGTALVGAGGELPLAFDLSPNEPNPFGRQTTIRFALPTTSRVRLEVFDLAGRKIATLLDGNQPAGLHSVVFRADAEKDLPSGVYFVHMSAGAFERTRKMLYLAR